MAPLELVGTFEVAPLEPGALQGVVIGGACLWQCRGSAQLCRQIQFAGQVVERPVLALRLPRASVTLRNL